MRFLMIAAEAPDVAAPPDQPEAPTVPELRLVEKIVVVAIAVVASVPLVFGFEALIVARDPPAKVLGALLCLFAVGAIAPVFFFLFGSQHVDFARLWGSVAGVAAATLALYEQYTVGDHTLLLIVWWVLLALSLLGLILAVHRRPEVGKREFWIGVAAVVTSTTVVGLAQYWWRTFYEPLRIVPVLDVTAKVSAASKATDGVVPLFVSITIKNPTTVAIQPLASLFTLSGFRPARATLSATQFRGMVGSTATGAPATSSENRYVVLKRALVAAGQLLPTDELIPAGGTRVVNLIVDTPSARPRFMNAGLRVQIAFVQSVRLTLVPVDHPVRCPHRTTANENDSQKARANICADFENANRPYTSAVVSEWEIPRRTWFAQKTSDHRYVLAAVVQAKSPSTYRHHAYFGSDTPYVFATASARSPNADRADPGRLGKYYFVSLVTATQVAQIPALPNAKIPAKSH